MEPMGAENSLTELARGGVSRRDFMKRAALLGVGAVAAGQILAACGDDDDDSTDAPAEERDTAAPAETVSGDSVGEAPDSDDPIQEDTGPKVGGTFREGYDRDLTGPDTVTSAWADPTFNGFHEALAIRNPEGVLVPMLASEFVSSDTGWEFTLREGLKFHHGGDLTPEVVVENFNMFRDPAVGVNAVFWAPIKDVTNDGNIVRCITDAPFLGFQETVSTEYAFILNPATREEYGDEYGSTIVDGTGPFRQTSFDARQGATGTRWDDYPGSIVPFFENKGTAYLDAVEWIPITEPAQRRNEIETRNVDAIKNPPPQDVDALSNNSDLVVQEFQELSNFFVSLNIGSTQFGFDDLRVRQAISHAIDRESIVASILRGRAVATYGPFLPGYKWYNPEVENFNQFDVDGARALLDEAGWVASGDGIREKDGARLSFPMLHLSEATENAVMEAIVEMLKEIGVDMQNTDEEASAFWPQINLDLVGYSFKALWSSPPDLAAYFFNNLQPAGAAAGSSASYVEWQTAGDEAGLRAAAMRMQAVVAEELPFIPIYTPNTVWVNHKDVVGWQPNQVNLYPFYNDVWMNR